MTNLDQLATGFGQAANYFEGKKSFFRQAEKCGENLAVLSTRSLEEFETVDESSVVPTLFGRPV